jgi:FtsZ-interacting cell division protein YlmF
MLTIISCPEPEPNRYEPNDSELARHHPLASQLSSENAFAQERKTQLFDAEAVDVQEAVAADSKYGPIAHYGVERFDEIEPVAKAYREGTTVVIDVAEDARKCRRVVDFCRGLSFATNGALYRVSSRRFVLLPEGKPRPPVQLLE